MQKNSKEMIPAAAYIRMSTDQQTDSPERQKMQIEEYAERNGYKIAFWYSDHGMTGTESKKRKSYQQLLTDAPKGLFKVVIVTEHSRLSREHFLKVFPQWSVFHEAGIKLINVQTGVIDFSTIGGAVMALVQQDAAHEESRKMADRTTTGKRNKMRLNQRFQAMRIFGYDRQIVDATGAVITQIGFERKFRKPPDCRAILVPSSNTAAVDGIVWAYEFVAGGGSVRAVAAEWNRLGLRSCRGSK